MRKNGKEDWYDMKKKRDVILFAVLILAGAAGLLAYRICAEPGAVAKVYIDDELVATLDLGRDGEYEYDTVYGHNKVIVKGGAVRMEEADCPDKVCVSMGAKDRSGEVITCLPHRLVIEIHSDRKMDVDA